MWRLVQVAHADRGRRVALVEGDQLITLPALESVYGLAMHAVTCDASIARVLGESRRGEILDYGSVYLGESDWSLLPAFDHPEEPSRCLISGTGLTHRASAATRGRMHAEDRDSSLTDSEIMYRWGLESGRPEPGQIGVQPEWFYKGAGTILRAHGQVLEVPAYADDGGEEAEVAAAYVVDGSGQPWRVGWMQGNEFSDHVMEKKNYLYLAPSKLHPCSIGPELVIGFDFTALRGRVAIERDGKILWEREVSTGEAAMCHSLANLEHHHFKHAAHRRPGDAHVHFLGADALSFSEGVRLLSGDIIEVAWRGLGRPLRNPVRVGEDPQALVRVRVL